MRTNTIEIPEKFSQQLAELPESATFIHKVKVGLSSGTVLSNRVVFNKTVLHLEEGEDFAPEEIVHIELEGPVHADGKMFFWFTCRLASANNYIRTF